MTSRHVLTMPLSIDCGRGTIGNQRHVLSRATTIDVATARRAVRHRHQDRMTHREDKGRGKTFICTRGTSGKLRHLYLKPFCMFSFLFPLSLAVT